MADICVGLIGVITEITFEDGFGVAHIDTGESAVIASLLTCPEARTGETVLVHSGFVLKILKEDR